MMLIVFSNSNWRKETFSFQNWLDPAKEIKKQIRSKFVIIVFFFQWFWKTFPFGIPRPPKLRKHKLLCLQTVFIFSTASTRHSLSFPASVASVHMESCLTDTWGLASLFPCWPPSCKGSGWCPCCGVPWLGVPSWKILVAGGLQSCSIIHSIMVATPPKNIHSRGVLTLRGTGACLTAPSCGEKASQLNPLPTRTEGQVCHRPLIPTYMRNHGIRIVWVGRDHLRPSISDRLQ